MYCQECQLHFSEFRTAGRCPSCGNVPEGGDRPSDSSSDTVTVGAVGGGGSDGRTRVSLKVLRKLSRPGEPDTRTDPGVADRWRPGDSIAGKYEVLCKIGDGGFGSVYKVRHIHRRKLYALKTPHEEFLRDETFRRRFEREIEALERFVHPDVVTIRDSGVTEDGFPYYTMDFLEGESLRKVLAREGPLRVRRAVNVARHILQVLEVAHGHQIIHRDIKPDNILLTRAGEREVVKVLDFGVAKLLDLAGNTASLTRGRRIGTPKYMSPEQVRGETVDGRSDLFAVGILLYEMLTGLHPFAVEQDPIRTTAAIISKNPRPPRSLRPEISRALSEQVLRLLEKRARRRPQTAVEALRGLPDLSTSAGRSTMVEAPLRVLEDVPRRPVTSLVLSRMTPAGLERSFLFFKPTVSFGRSSDLRRGIENDILLRCLPCRGKQLDPENFRLNLTISHRVATLAVDRSCVVLRPDERSSHGIVVGGLRSREPVRIQSDRFHLSLGDRALEIDGYRALRNNRRRPFDLSFLQPDPPADGTDRPDGRSPPISYSNPDCLVDFVRLTRGNNHQLHRYFLVHRRVPIGSGATTGICLDESSVRGRHATVLFENGEAFLVPSGGEVRFLTEAAVTREPSTGEYEGTTLPADALLPLSPGMFLLLGTATLRVEAVSPEMYKSI